MTPVAEQTRAASGLQRRIFVATATVGILTVGAKAGVAIRELLVAREFGAGHEVDAFLIAFALPLFAINIVSGAIPSALVPVLVRRRTAKGREAAQDLVRHSLGLACLGVLGICAALAAVSPLVVRVLGSGLAARDVWLAVRFFVLLLPIVVLAAVSAVAASVVNADERFAATSTVQILNPVVTVGILLAFVGPLGIDSLVLASVAGYAVETAGMLLLLRHNGWSIRPRLDRPFDDDTRQVLLQLAPMAGATFLTGTNVLVDQSIASTAGVGGVAHLAYGSRIVSLLLQVVAFALATVLLPHFSRLLADRDWAGLGSTLRTQTVWIALLSAPMTVALVVASRPIIELAFERGAFSAGDASVVAHVQALYALQLLPHMVGIVWVRLLSALQASRRIVQITVANLVINVVTDLLFVRWLGVEGIALSTSLVYTCSTVLIGLALRAELRRVR